LDEGASLNQIAAAAVTIKHDSSFSFYTALVVGFVVACQDASRGTINNKFYWNIAFLLNATTFNILLVSHLCILNGCR